MLNLSLIDKILAKQQPIDQHQVRDVLAKARLAKGLDLAEAAVLFDIQSEELTQELFATARDVKNQIYGNRLVLFAPLYISNLCANECLYCAFRAQNKEVKRRCLNLKEIATETKHLIEQGQKRLLIVAGEAYPNNGFQYILDAIKTVYNVKHEHGEVRRINVNIAPLDLDDFKRLKQTGIGTYQLFQETYHPEIYKKMHVAGKKADYEWRFTAMDRALQAGIDDVGMGVLFGLADWRFEVLALLQHAQYLRKKYGVGPHTISVPRLEPAVGSTVATNPPHPLSDEDFRKIIAILRLAIPSTGIILSSREDPDMRREALALGISQIAAGCRTNPGGYSTEDEATEQFSLGDHRSLEEVVLDVIKLGYVPSFCTSCYRSHRTGKHFMELADSGAIKKMCEPNALLTFQEYLLDFASLKTKFIGENLIADELKKMPSQQQSLVSGFLTRIKNGERDLHL